MRVLQSALCAALALIAACGDDVPKPMSIQVGGNITVSLGQELRVAYQEVGPGAVEIPASISSPVVAFIDFAQAGTVGPAGPTSVFHFRAIERGTATIYFSRIDSLGVRLQALVDTVNVY